MDKLQIKEGLTDKQIDQLIEHTVNDDAILKLTHDSGRFTSFEQFQQWSQKPHKIYTLTNNNGDLLGIVWFDQSAIPEVEFTEEFDAAKYQYTFAIRLYGEARGKGLSEKFFNECLDMYKKSDNYINLSAKGLWLATNSQNVPAISLYKKLGFKIVSDINEKGIYMIRDDE
jgi:ribosomal protein S18 acetylase RimI-like enzyme